MLGRIFWKIVARLINWSTIFYFYLFPLEPECDIVVRFLEDENVFIVPRTAAAKQWGYNTLKSFPGKKNSYGGQGYTVPRKVYDDFRRTILWPKRISISDILEENNVPIATFNLGESVKRAVRGIS